MPKPVFLFTAMLLNAFSLGCGSSRTDASTAANAQQPGSVAPKDDLERGILSSAAALSMGESTTIGDRTVTVDDTYHAASGRECKSLRITAAKTPENGEHRLICRIDDEWKYAPVVHPSAGSTD